MPLTKVGADNISLNQEVAHGEIEDLEGSTVMGPTEVPEGAPIAMPTARARSFAVKYESPCDTPRLSSFLWLSGFEVVSGNKFSETVKNKHSRVAW